MPMTRISALIQHVTLSLLAILAITGSVAAQTPSQIERVGRFYQLHDGFNGSVTVIKNGRVVSNQMYGFANFEWKIPLAADSRMFIGSETKQFTAAAILLLQEQGRLRTGDPISKFYPAAPPTWNKITIHQLLTHTSGIPDDIATAGYPMFERGNHTPQELVRAVADKPLLFTPGSSSAYSNLEYVLLGLIIEAASGQSYSDFLQHFIFDPLEMKDTGYISNSGVIPHRAYGYSPVRGGVKLATESPEVWNFFAAGALYSTGADLARWMIALHGGKILSPASYQEMVSADRDEYAYGLTVSTQYGATDIGHLGDVPGFHSAIEYFPKFKTGIIVLCNVRATLGTGGSTPGVFAIDNELMQLAVDEHSIVRSSEAAAKIPNAILQSYVGRYTLQNADHPQSMTLEVIGDILTIAPQESGKNQSTLRAESPKRFYTVEWPGEIEFSSDPTGATVMTVFNYANETASTWIRAKDK